MIKVNIPLHNSWLFSLKFKESASVKAVRSTPVSKNIVAWFLCVCVKVLHAKVTKPQSFWFLFLNFLRFRENWFWPTRPSAYLSPFLKDLRKYVRTTFMTSILPQRVRYAIELCMWRVSSYLQENYLHTAMVLFTPVYRRSRCNPKTGCFVEHVSHSIRRMK